MKTTLTKEQFKIKLIETKIYEELKDVLFVTASLIRVKYPEYEGLIDYGRIYKRIVDYRIKTYGTSMTSSMSSSRYEQFVGRNNIL